MELCLVYLLICFLIFFQDPNINFFLIEILIESNYIFIEYEKNLCHFINYIIYHFNV